MIMPFIATTDGAMFIIERIILSSQYCQIGSMKSSDRLKSDFWIINMKRLTGKRIRVLDLKTESELL
jgi:hypothetical protein